MTSPPFVLGPRHCPALPAACASLITALAAPTVARAQHHHDASADTSAVATAQTLSAGLDVSAAGFDTALYTGSYQALTPSLAWARGALAASAAIGLYQAELNGRRVRGAGDLMLMGHAALWTSGAVAAGVALHASLPTGAERDSLGMGHVMVTPQAWAQLRRGPLSLEASAGYARALVSLAGGGHDHGASPVVDPMALQELTWTAGARLELTACRAHCLRISARAVGAQPFGVAMTTARVVAGGGLTWDTRRIGASLAVDAGVAGDPFSLRGMLGGKLRF